MAVLTSTSPRERAMEALKRSGNPFRNYFARHPDDDVCARYHVPELYARERTQLLAVVDLYRYDAAMHSEVVPILGNKGAGKTHLLYSLKHGPANGWQLVVTPGTYQKGSEFAEYVLFQIIDTLLGGGRQRGKRPLEFVGEDLARKLVRGALTNLTPAERMELFPAPGLARWARKLGIGAGQAAERTQWLVETFSRPSGLPVRAACQEANLDPASLCNVVNSYVDRTEPRNTAGQMRRRIYHGFLRSVLLGEESDLAAFLTDGFAALEYQVRPSRQDLVIALFKALMDVFLTLKIPVVVAFDQLEDLLLARRTDDGHRVSESFFAGIVQLMHQVDGLCFLIFAERGLWNRFVPSLDGYIQDRLNNPIHLPDHGTIKTLRLEAPPEDLVRRVVAARLRPALEDVPDADELDALFPFTEDQVARVARTEPTLRDMLQQFRLLFDHVIYGAPLQTGSEPPADTRWAPLPEVKRFLQVETPVAAPAEPPPVVAAAPIVPPAEPVIARIDPPEATKPQTTGPARVNLTDLWLQEVQTARLKLEPEGALTGATRELQAGLGVFLQTCLEHGVKVGPWRLMHVVSEWTFGDHPTYGAMSIAHWIGKSGQPWRLGVGLFLGRGPGKPKDLQVKLAAFDGTPPVIDQLVLLRPIDDTTLSGKSKTLWDDATKRQHQMRLEPVGLDEFAAVYGFPRWLSAVTESLGAGQSLPNLADFIQEHCASLLGCVCLPENRE